MLDPDIDLVLVESTEDVFAFKEWLGRQRSILAVDSETSGLEWWKGRLRLVQFGDRTAGWAIPWDRWAGLVLEVFDRYEDELVFHNMKFDLHWLETNGCKIKRHKVHDTAVLAHLDNPTQPLALKNLAGTHIDAKAAAGQSELKKAMALQRWTWDTVPADFGGYWVYSALDTVLTAHLYDHFASVRQTYAAPYDVEIACNLVLMDMESRGMQLDRAYALDAQEKLVVFADQLREWIKAEFHTEAGSNKANAAILLRDGVRLTKKTESGAWSMDESVLAWADHPLADAILEVRKAEKMANSYFKNFVEMADANDLIHCSVKPLGARTGRMTVTGPALQTLQRGRLVRDAFTSREGRRLVGVDYKQIEARMMAHLSGDPDLIGAFAEGDFFINIAGRIYGDTGITKADPRRQLTKNAVYAKNYGAGAAKFALTAGVTEREGAEFYAMFDRAFPGVRAFQKRIEREALMHDPVGVWSPTGKFHRADRDKVYTLVNYLIQGTAADILKQKILELDAAGLADYLVLPIHDELIFDVPADDVDAFTAEAVSILEDRENWAVPLEVDPHSGERWGDLK